ncbi:hypothetical protein AJ79_03532 [Helicocarpus griseus UAMH5409]|uniref:Uncharacterized protein n=1 Tax=Helicocarpus griseus UAMH5409 TaxID=1447875 RepID=A0A2B7XY24_9EURO|nr:hypothetical protein AJ79_03532 [Helicocarpus griseus UAMH5409]
MDGINNGDNGELIEIAADGDLIVTVIEYKTIREESIDESTGAETLVDNSDPFKSMLRGKWKEASQSVITLEEDNKGNGIMVPALSR